MGDSRSNKLGDKEDEIVREAHAALKLIKTEGSAVAFAEVFEQVLARATGTDPKVL